MLDAHASTPSGYMIEKPTGPYDEKRMMNREPNAQQIVVNGKSIWVGIDTLTNRAIRPIDGAKYSKDHLRILFSAGLAEWIKKHKVTVPPTLRLSVACGMPAERFQDATLRKAAEKAYRAAFKVNNADQWRITINGKQVRLLPESIQLNPETTHYGSVSRLDPGYTIVLDCGHGTVDAVVFHSSQPAKPLTVKSFNVGLAHAFDDLNAVRMETPELLLIRGELDSSCLDPYLAQIQSIAMLYTRKLEEKRQPIKVRIIGGLPHLLSKEQKDRFSIGAKYVFGDSSENAKMFCALLGK